MSCHFFIRQDIMKFTLKNTILSTLALGMATLAPQAQAQVPQLFATFSQVGQIPEFSFSSDSSGATLGLASAIPVNFQYQTANGLGAGVGESLAATMTMSSVSAATSFTSAGFLVQPLKDIQIRFTSTGAPADSGDLLTMSLSTGNLVGRPGGQTARLTGTESATGTSIVNFDSNYLDFKQPLLVKNFSISFTSVAPEITNGGNGYIAPFSATATGNFGSDPLPPQNSIPEPGTLALLALGIGGGLALAHRRKAS